MAAKIYDYKLGEDGPTFKMVPIEIEKSEESWTKLHLEDGTILKIKIVVTKVGRSIDKPIPDRDGEPLYHIQSGNIVIAEIPDDLYFEVEE